MTVSEWLAVTSGSLLFEFWPHVDYPELITSSWFSLVYSEKKIEYYNSARHLSPDYFSQLCHHISFDTT
jgi:hypothetical protein